MDKLYKLEKKTIIEGFPPFFKKKRKRKEHEHGNDVVVNKWRRKGDQTQKRLNIHRPDKTRWQGR